MKTQERPTGKTQEDQHLKRLTEIMEQAMIEHGSPGQPLSVRSFTKLINNYWGDTYATKSSVGRLKNVGRDDVKDKSRKKVDRYLLTQIAPFTPYSADELWAIAQGFIPDSASHNQESVKFAVFKPQQDMEYINLSYNDCLKISSAIRATAELRRQSVLDFLVEAGIKLVDVADILDPSGEDEEGGIWRKPKPILERLSLHLYQVESWHLTGYVLAFLKSPCQTYDSLNQFLDCIRKQNGAISR